MARRQKRSGSYLTLDYQPILDAADLMRRAGPDFTKKARAKVNREVGPWAKHAVRSAARGKGPQSMKIANTTRLRTGQNPAIITGGSGKVGRAKARDLARVYEFGGYRRYRNPGYRSRRGSTTFTVRDRATQQQIPRSNRRGRFFYQAMADTGPALARAWVGAIADTYREAGFGDG